MGLIAGATESPQCGGTACIKSKKHSKCVPVLQRTVCKSLHIISQEYCITVYQLRMKTVQLTVLFVCGLLSYYSVKGFPNREYNSVESVCDLIPKSFPNMKKIGLGTCTVQREIFIWYKFRIFRMCLLCAKIKTTKI